jgi:AraC family transcriptional regulator, exoenzyme S synthesis regulatory protein ExsA
MDKDFFTLPEDFGIAPRDTSIYFYSNTSSSVKNKVVFTKNMLCMVHAGVKEVQTAEGKEVITNQEVLLLSSGSTLMSESVAEDSKYEAILVFFSNEVLVDFCKGAALQNSSSPVKKIYKIQKDPFLNNFCQSLQFLRAQGHSEMDELKTREILQYISLMHPEMFRAFMQQALTAKADIKLKQVVELNINKGLSIEELAFLCNMSVSTFKRHFSAIYKMSPQKYFTQLKMDQARLLLSLRKRPSEIYLELGYSNLSAFSSEFKKFFGQPPTQFQDQVDLIEKAVELVQ